MLDALKGNQSAMEVSKGEVYSIIEHLTEELVNTDPNIVKSAIHSMIEEIVVWPKGPDKERVAEVRGSCLPLTRVQMVTPRGLEPLLPA